MPTIQNIVSTCYFCQEINMKLLAIKLHGSVQTTKFSAIISKLEQPKTTALIFKTGKMVIAGAKSIIDAKRLP
uniref:TATA-box binding protein n=1 Tax=Ditylenchus dipsaci TaxID=166011 RepID=A0A915DT17_9BILA